MVELLVPVGNFDSLKAAVQNGADAVYFGGENFNARAFAENFDNTTLKKAIKYAKIRGVKTNLVLNILLKDYELKPALLLAKRAYEYGIDAIIVQDLGLAEILIKNFPDLPIHASTQMSIHNLEGVQKLEKLGFKRVILSRELSLNEIEFICKNTKVEIECFVHGALCISYSGQCLFSSMVGGRSGNRGKCAQSCRLPYTLLENNTKIDSGYLLSTADLCALEVLPNLISAGVKSLKIEGRMKSSEYVAVVTRIYRKYVDLANKCVKNSDLKYVVDPEDTKQLMQVFNRGNFSTGHLINRANRNLVFPEKPNNMGLFLGIIQKYNIFKGHITIKLNEVIEVGDTISIENESGTYTVSELMQNGQNIKEAQIGDVVTIGRMKGNIRSGFKIYKISSKKLLQDADDSFSKENRKVMLNGLINIEKGKPISIDVTPYHNAPLVYKNMHIKCLVDDAIPVEADKHPLQAENVVIQINKTHNSPYEFKNIKINLDNNVFLPKVSMLNELRRTALEKVEEFAYNNIVRSTPDFNFVPYTNKVEISSNNICPDVSVLLNSLDIKFNYDDLDKSITNIYIPLKFFVTRSYKKIIKTLAKSFNIFIYMPTIITSNYRNIFIANIAQTLENFHIKGFVVSNIGNIQLLETIGLDLNNYEIVSNYTFHPYNTQTVLKLKSIGIDKFTPSCELEKNSLLNLCKCDILPKELIIYGKLPLMHTKYCLLGKSNLCYPECLAKCTSDNKYYLQDRLKMKFRIIPNHMQTVTSIYNCKTLSICHDEFPVDSVRIDILDENIKEINKVVDMVYHNKRFEGKEFTSGNLGREV